METQIFIRYQLPPVYVDWCKNEGLLLANVDQIEYTIEPGQAHSKAIFEENRHHIIESPEMDIRSLLNPKLSFLDIVMHRQDTNHSFKRMLKNKSYKPIMVFITPENDFGVFFYNYKTRLSFCIRCKRICDLLIRFKNQINPLFISRTPSEIKIRFSYNGLFPEEVVDFGQATAIMSLYDDHQPVADYVVTKDNGDKTTIIVHQYIDSS